jgi:hypothetical protein
MKRYLLSIVMALNFVANALLGGSPMESISYRAAMAREHGGKFGTGVCRVFEAMDFHPKTRVDHCTQAIEDHWRYMEQVNAGKHPRGDR